MVLLCILDGFGLREPLPDNAVAAAHKPVYDEISKSFPFTKIDGSGVAVGLPDGQMGNSEVGHLNLGAGRIVYQDISRIDRSIESGEFYKIENLIKCMKEASNGGHALHLFGLISDGKVHSSLDHIYALVKMAKDNNVTELYLHAFMDGRDTSPTAGIDYMQQVLDKFKEFGLGKVATVGGRYYGMDRDKRWERVEKAYQTIVYGEGVKFSSPIEAIKKSYENIITDEFITPVVIDNADGTDGKLKEGDTAIFFNFRADRVRQLSALFMNKVEPEFRHNDSPKINLVTMTHYDDNLTEAEVIFKPVRLKNILGKVLAHNNLKQLRTAETEKYAHVTFFFNGGVEAPFDGETRDLIPSPKVATYDLKPEMSSVELTDRAVQRILGGEHDFVLLNYANCDMVGHTGNFEAAKKAVEAVDRGLGRLLEAVKKQKGVAIVTADHGNAEMMFNPEIDGVWTAHTTNLVPCILYDPSEKLSKNGKRLELRQGGILADIAPTVLDILKINKPEEMTGKSLIIRE